MAGYTVAGSLYRLVAVCLSAALLLSPITVDAAQQPTGVLETAQAQDVGGSANPAPSGKESLPDDPSLSQTSSQASPTPQSPPPAKQEGGTPAQQPVGTAAAGIENTAGVAASKPAGVAIAPPKQRRVRLLIIKVGAILGAGAALGTVAALSKASPSRPPGAH